MSVSVSTNLVCVNSAETNCISPPLRLASFPYFIMTHSLVISSCLNVYVLFVYSNVCNCLN